MLAGWRVFPVIARTANMVIADCLVLPMIFATRSVD
jgi:hypothetical protein